ncbi:hypothetical protein DENSPDRAFT_843589 [Dentipellis sp. KUC8613]|nr:hypothetical protein DENSPDRAFT_843589 [Dentipellis sp. KUC8613]
MPKDLTSKSTPRAGQVAPRDVPRGRTQAGQEIQFTDMFLGIKGGDLRTAVRNAVDELFPPSRDAPATTKATGGFDLADLAQRRIQQQMSLLYGNTNNRPDESLTACETPMASRSTLSERRDVKDPTEPEERVEAANEGTTSVGPTGDPGAGTEKKRKKDRRRMRGGGKGTKEAKKRRDKRRLENRDARRALKAAQEALIAEGEPIPCVVPEGMDAKLDGSESAA